jgi:ribosomal protein S18 acetylase RimI-like enzyme
MEQSGEIVATLACPPDPPSVAWVRLFAASNRFSAEKAWKVLWPYAYAQLKEDENLNWVTAIPMHRWFISLLETSSFRESHRVVVLRWEGVKLPEGLKPSTASVRPMTLDDLSAVRDIDRASFVPVWQNSISYLEVAFRQAIVATVAEEEGALAGYQISTGTPLGGHLARLAVHPQRQGRGIGYALLQDLLTQLSRRGARAITVNTQKNNLASLALYNKAGFQPTGEEYPFYQLDIREDR